MIGIIKRPIVTEKMTELQDKGHYAFEVDIHANKIEIAKAEQEVVTVVAGKPETRNVAKPGDYIVTGALGERYVIPGNRF
ncbi:MAG: 50S ribosomal protein L23, partial [Bacteroidota bacterium]